MAVSSDHRLFAHHRTTMVSIGTLAGPGASASSVVQRCSPLTRPIRKGQNVAISGAPSCSCSCSACFFGFYTARSRIRRDAALEQPGDEATVQRRETTSCAQWPSASPASMVVRLES